MKLSMYTKQTRRLILASIIAMLLAQGLFTGACVWIVDYTVVNQTGDGLLTWPLLVDCDKKVRNKEDLLGSRVVGPWGRLNYMEKYGGPDAHCVQVTTSDKRLLLSEPYENGKTYIVGEKLQSQGYVVPDRADLPHQSWSEGLRELPPIYLAGLPVFGAAFVAAVFISIRFFCRYYRRKAP